VSSIPDSTGLLVRKIPVGTDYQLVAVNLQDGSMLEDLQPLELGYEYNYGYSTGSQQLAVAGRHSKCPSYCLQVIDLASWKVSGEMELSFLKNASEYISGLIFDRHGARLLVITNHQLRPQSKLTLIDLNSMQLLHQVELPISYIQAAISNDGSRLMIVGSGHPSRPAVLDDEPAHLWASLYDSNSLALQWEQPIEEMTYGMYSTDGSQDFESMVFIQPAVVLDADRNRVWIAHASENRLTLVDFDQQQVSTREVRPRRSWIERILELLISLGVTPVEAKVQNMMSRSGVLSPDGSELYSVSYRTHVTYDGSEWKTEQAVSGLQVWNLENSTLEAEFDTAGMTVRSAMGKVLLIDWTSSSDQSEGYPITYVYDPLQKEMVASIEGVDVFQALDRSGNPFLVSTDYRTGTTIHTVLAEDFTPQFVWEDRHSFWLGLY
jgi:hypothetical protein